MGKTHLLKNLFKRNNNTIKCLLFSFSFFISLFAHGQDWSTKVYRYGEIYPGYVIDKEGTKIEGFIKYQDRYTMQTGVMFYTDKEDKKSRVKYKTSNLKEYQVADKLYHCIHYSGGLLTKPIRACLVVIKGCITEYVWYDRAENYSTMQKGLNESREEFMYRMYPATMLFLIKGSEEVKTLKYFGVKFAVNMAEYVSDNEEISAKVASKEKGYGVVHILDIINEYNLACKE